MLLKCNECGHDNQLGAIFCRSCGTKLDVETIRPKIDSKVTTNFFGIIRRVVTGIILLVLIYIIAAMFYPASPSSNILAEDQQTKASENFKAMLRKMDGNYGETTYVFTPDELTYLYNNEMTESADPDADVGSYAIENMYFTIDSRNFVHIMIQSKLGGKIPVTFELKGILVEDSVQFNVLKTKMGHLGLPNFIKAKIIEKFTPGTDEGVMKTILDSAASFKIENGDFMVTVKQK
jgi:zinc ribbon protein